MKSTTGFLITSVLSSMLRAQSFRLRCWRIAIALDEIMRDGLPQLGTCNWTAMSIQIVELLSTTTHGGSADAAIKREA